MKKHNFLFIGECAIVLAFLVLIGIMVKDEKQLAHGRESVKAVVELEDGAAEETGFLSKLLAEQDEVVEEETMPEENKVEANTNVHVSEEGFKEIEEKNEAVVGEASKELKTVENTVSDNHVSAIEEDKVKIVVFGDSIWNEGRGTDGISEQLLISIFSIFDSV